MLSEKTNKDIQQYLDVIEEHGFVLKIIYPWGPTCNPLDSSLSIYLKSETGEVLKNTNRIEYVQFKVFKCNGVGSSSTPITFTNEAVDLIKDIHDFCISDLMYGKLNRKQQEKVDYDLDYYGKNYNTIDTLVVSELEKIAKQYAQSFSPQTFMNIVLSEYNLFGEGYPFHKVKYNFNCNNCGESTNDVEYLLCFSCKK